MPVYANKHSAPALNEVNIPKSRPIPFSSVSQASVNEIWSPRSGLYKYSKDSFPVVLDRELFYKSEDF